MSRGPGKLQRVLFGIIRGRPKPVTFAETLVDPGEPPPPTAELNPTRVRSWRRALKSLVDGGAILALGKGGPGDPHRYCMNPIVMAIGGTKEQFQAACTVAESPSAPDLRALRERARQMNYRLLRIRGAYQLRSSDGTCGGASDLAGIAEILDTQDYVRGGGVMQVSSACGTPLYRSDGKPVG